MNNKAKILVLKSDGTNCDEETKFAFELAGGEAKLVHVNELRIKKESLKNYQILALPGGFSYGDDIVSGKILATELTSFFAEELQSFINKNDTLIIGICNGFQVLVRTGLLPFAKIGKMEATLTDNDSGKFECRWINLKVEKSKCVFINEEVLKQVQNDIVSFQVAHGEGKFFASPEIIKKIEDENLVTFRYADENGNPTQKYPQNPNGAINSIAGICDPTGRILGMMPHPERFVKIEQHPNWRRMAIKEPQGLPIFKNMIKYVKNA